MTDDTSRADQPHLRTAFNNHDIIGKLIKSWSTKDPSYTGGKLYPEPRNGKELRTILAQLGASITIPDDMEVAVIHYGENTMVLRVPPPGLIKAKEAELKKPGKTYNLPTFYGNGPIEGTGPNATPQQKLLLQERRIGDYTISHCE